MAMQWHISSETCLIGFLPNPISLAQQQFCWQLAEQLKDWGKVTETVVGMNTLTVYTQPLSAQQLLDLQHSLTQLSSDEKIANVVNNFQPISTSRHVEIPVRYGGEYGIDLKSAAAMKGMSVAELVAAHTTPVYTVYFIGFQAGFPYLGGLLENLYMPRHEVPRLEVPAGSVGIGGQQTGIYPFTSPGGWQLLGRTDLPLFNLDNEQPTLLKAGDTLSFVAVEVITDD